MGEVRLWKNNCRIIDYELRVKDYWCAADILRYAVLSQYGGIYIDVDMMPPNQEKIVIDLLDVVSPTGLTLTTEEFGRECGQHSGLFVMNGLIAAPAQDATMVHARDSLCLNWAAINRHARRK